jgi:hypothetical protein
MGLQRENSRTVPKMKEKVSNGIAEGELTDRQKNDGLSKIAKK